MVRRLLVFAATISIAILSAVSAHADTVPLLDPLHGYCAGAGQCIDNGINSPTTNNPPINFGFTISPGPASGNLLIDVLTPNNEAVASSYTLTGTLAGTANKFAATPWTSGNLDAYLGLSASPSNPIGAYTPSTDALDPGATGFFVYQVSFPSVTLLNAANPNISPLENLSTGLPLGSYIVAFLNEGTATAPKWIATANSGAIFDTTGPTTTPVPEPGALTLLGTGLLALAGIARRSIRKA